MSEVITTSTEEFSNIWMICLVVLDRMRAYPHTETCQWDTQGNLNILGVEICGGSAGSLAAKPDLT